MRRYVSFFACLSQKYGLLVEQKGLEFIVCFKIVKQFFFTTLVQLNKFIALPFLFYYIIFLT